MIHARQIEIEKIQLRIEIYQEELSAFLRVLKKLEEDNKLNDPAIISWVSIRLEDLKKEHSKLGDRFQSYKQGLVNH